MLWNCVIQCIYTNLGPSLGKTLTHLCFSFHSPNACNFSLFPQMPLVNPWKSMVNSSPFPFFQGGAKDIWGMKKELRKFRVFPFCIWHSNSARTTLYGFFTWISQNHWVCFELVNFCSVHYIINFIRCTYSHDSGLMVTFYQHLHIMQHE